MSAAATVAALISSAAMVDEPLPFADGDVVAGKYRIGSLIGTGAFGVVFAARHVELDEDVAIKVLRKTTADEGAAERLVREARTAARLKGEHVVRVLDVGRLSDTGVPYIVMERLEGNDLEWHLAERGALPIEEAVGHVLHTCEALAEAHALGMVHRDLKLSNLFLTRRADGTPSVKVLDFGIAKWTNADPNAKRLTGKNIGMGSPLYMSPEQLGDASDADARSDLWSLGVILHELVAGAPPFDAETATGVMAAVLTKDPPPLRQVLPSAPAGLEEIILRCLVKNRDARMASVTELATALEPFASEEDRACVRRIGRLAASKGTRVGLASLPDAGVPESARGREAGPPSGARATQHAAEVSSTADAIAAGLGRRSRRWPWAALGAVVIVIGGAAFVTTRRSPPPTPASAPVATPVREAVPPPPPPAESTASIEPSAAPAMTPSHAPAPRTGPTSVRAAPPRPAATTPAEVASSKPVVPSSPPSGKRDDLRSLIDGRR